MQTKFIPPIDSETLNREARYFHKYLFGEVAEPSFVELYHTVHLEQPSIFAASDREIACINQIVSRKLNPVAIEPWLRKQSQHHLLSRKLLLATYLAEADGRHISRFHLQAPISLYHAWPLVFLSLTSGALQLAHGKIQIIWYDLL